MTNSAVQQHRETTCAYLEVIEGYRLATLVVLELIVLPLNVGGGLLYLGLSTSCKSIVDVSLQRANCC